MSTAPRRYERQGAFGQATRFYETEGKKVPSVTSILSAIAKPALVPWAAKLEREAVVRAAAELYADLPLNTPRMNKTAYVSTLERRLGGVKEHIKALAAAADIGSAVHNRI